MPYSDINKQKQYFKEYKLKNKEKYNKLSLELYHKKKLNEEWKNNRNKKRQKLRLNNRMLGIKEPRSIKREISWMTKKYGLTVETYNQILQNQGGVCKICGLFRNGKMCKYLPLSIDHDHKTGAVRGLLCMRCNSMLGCAEDNIVYLESGIKYLKEYEQKNKA